MTYTIAQIRGFSYGPMESAQQAAQADEQQAAEGINRFDQAMHRLTSVWHGKASDAAAAHTARRNATGQSVINDIHMMLREMLLAAEQMKAARQAVLSTVQAAEAAGFHVDETTGHVAPASNQPAPNSPAGSAAAAAARQQQLMAQARAWEDKIQRQLERFDSLDAQNAEALGAPGVTSAHDQVVIAEVESSIASGKSLTPQLALAALHIPYQRFTPAIRNKLALWVKGHPEEVSHWVGSGHKVDLPPAPHGGYNMTVTYQPSDDMKLSYAVTIPAGAAVAGMVFSRGGMKPGLSGEMQTPGGSASVDAEDGGDMEDGGFSATALGDTIGGDGIGITLDSDGPWLTANHTTNLDTGSGDNGTVVTTLDLRPHAKLPDNVHVQTENWFERWVHERERHFVHNWHTLTGPAPSWWPTPSTPSAGDGGVVGVIKKIIEGLGTDA